jgi:hypothetical protein
LNPVQNQQLRSQQLNHQHLPQPQQLQLQPQLKPLQLQVVSFVLQKILQLTDALDQRVAYIQTLVIVPHSFNVKSMLMVSLEDQQSKIVPQDSNGTMPLKYAIGPHQIQLVKSNQFRQLLLQPLLQLMLQQLQRQLMLRQMLQLMLRQLLPRPTHQLHHLALSVQQKI